MSQRSGRRRALIAAPAASLIIAALLVHRGADGPSPSTDARHQTVAPRPGHARVMPGRVGLPAARLSGHVVSAATGTAVTDAIVSVSQLGLDRRGRETRGDADAATATTDVSGGFTLGGLSPGRWSVSATAPGHRPATLEGVVLIAGAAEEVELRLAAGGSRLEGSVTDIGGGSVEGALVRARHVGERSIAAIFRAPFTARTDAAGRYALDLEDGRYDIQVHHADYAAREVSIELYGPQQRDFALTPGGTIEGVVRERSGRPVGGALVAATITNHEGRRHVLTGIGDDRAVSGPDGRFVLRGLAAGAIQLRAAAPGFGSAEPTTIELRVAEQTVDVVLQVDRAFSITGTVVARGDREPIAGALVSARDLSRGAVLAARDPSGDDGRFAIHGLQPGSYAVGAAADRRVPSPTARRVAITEADLDGVVIELDTGATLRGRVVPPRVALLWLEVDPAIGIGNMLYGIAASLVSARSDERGSFDLAAVPFGNFRVHAETLDGEQGELGVEVDGDQDGLVIRLEPRGSVAGLVVDEDGRPVAGVTVHIDPVEKLDPRADVTAGGGGSLTTDDAGRFSARNLDEGVHEVVVHGGAQLAWAGRTGEAALRPIRIRVAPAAPIRDLRLIVEARREELHGIVIGPDGAPAADAGVTAAFISWDTATLGEGLDLEQGDDDVPARTEQRVATRRQMRAWFPRENPVLTDDRGRFTIKNLRRGTYDLHAELPGGDARGTVEGVATGKPVTVKLHATAPTADPSSRPNRE